MNANDKQVIQANIKKVFKQLKRDKVVGIAMGNLFQITPTTGVTGEPALYRPTFEEVAWEVARKTKFWVY